MTNDTLEQQTTRKRSILNILAIIGFIAAVIVVAWLSLLFVRAMPQMFSSLASLSDSLYRPSGKISEIVITNTVDSAPSGETVTITWNESPTGGTFTFSHACVDGVAIEIINEASNQPVRCDTTYSLGEVTALTVRVSTDTSVSKTIPYTIAFLRTNDTEPLVETTDSLTVTVASPEVTTPAPEVITSDAVAVVPAPAITQTPEPTAPAAPSPVVTTPTPTTPQYEYFSYTPISDQNGYTDLALRFIDLGTTNGNRLQSSDTLSTREENFYSFEVRNIGSKTSDVWGYTIELPDSTKHTKANRPALKPNERAVVTIRFNLESSNKSVGQVITKVTTNRDSSSTNNRLSWFTTIR